MKKFQNSTKKKIKSKSIKFKKNLKNTKNKESKLKNIPKDTILKVIRLQEKLKPNYSIVKKFYFGLEKSLENFFNRIDGIIEGYKILKNEEKKRKKLEEIQRIENERIEKDNKIINIGSAGGMTRLSTGYTFLNIQEHSKYLRENLEKIESKKVYHVGKKYEFLDKIFLRVIKNNPDKMPEIFYKMFQNSANTVIRFLSNKSNIFEDLKIISKMPKIIFLKALIK